MKKLLLICCLFIGFTTAGRAQADHPTVSDPAEKAKGLQKELHLTDHQTAKIALIYQESAKKFGEIKAKENGDTNKMLADIGPLRAATIKKIKALLTYHQAVKYDKLIKVSSSSSINGGWSDGWS
jgi:periplasmic protein CpxP/Spy